MAVFTGISLSGDSTEDIVDAITALNRSLEYQMSNIDDDNIKELDYSKMIGGPPANADNTDDVLTVDGSNFTLVNGAYVYSGPANYSQISGGPPSNADNTANSLPASLGINFTKIGVNYIYTGTLSANQINAGTLNANYINGGTLTGIAIRTAGNSRRIEMDYSGFRTYDTTGTKRFAIEEGSNDWQELKFYGESGMVVGGLDSTNGGCALKSYNSTNLILHGSRAILITNTTPWIDFANVEIRNFNANLTAKFG